MSGAGVIQLMLHTSPNMYHVQFEGYDQPKLMHPRDLERPDQAPKSLQVLGSLPCLAAISYLVTSLV
jgi:hypothetical protein